MTEHDDTDSQEKPDDYIHLVDERGCVTRIPKGLPKGFENLPPEERLRLANRGFEQRFKRGDPDPSLAEVCDAFNITPAFFEGLAPEKRLMYVNAAIEKARAAKKH